MAHGNVDDPHAELELMTKLGLPADSDLPAEVLRVKAGADPEAFELQMGLSDARGELAANTRACRLAWRLAAGGPR